MDAVILAVSHKVFEKLSPDTLNRFYKKRHTRRVLADIKGILDRERFEEAGYLYWRL